MRVRNVHERWLPLAPAEAAALLDGLASRDDRFWPQERWPAMRLDRPLGVGARGGHGPIRYVVTAHEPGRRVEFRFEAPRGFDGIHTLALVEDGTRVRMRHVIEMDVRGPALLSWPLVFRPLHDALLEDALDKAERGRERFRETPARWSCWVRTLRRLLAPPRRRR